MKYIDTDKLKNELESIYDNMLKRIKIDKDNSDYWGGKADAYRNVIVTLETLSEEPDKSLEEAAEEYATTHLRNNEFPTADSAFIAGAKWQAEQDDRDVVFWKGMQHAIAGMKKDAVEGVIIDSGFDDGTAFVTMNIPDRRYDRGDRVKLIIIKGDGKSD